MYAFTQALDLYINSCYTFLHNFNLLDIIYGEDNTMFCTVLTETNSTLVSSKKNVKLGATNSYNTNDVTIG